MLGVQVHKVPCIVGLVVVVEFETFIAGFDVEVPSYLFDDGLC